MVVTNLEKPVRPDGKGVDNLRRRVYISLGALIWLVIGIVVAVNHGYDFHSVAHAIDFILATILWPLVLFAGTHFHVHM